jgi:hypothetical protein
MSSHSLRVYGRRRAKGPVTAGFGSCAPVVSDAFVICALKYETSLQHNCNSHSMKCGPYIGDGARDIQLAIALKRRKPRAQPAVRDEWFVIFWRLAQHESRWWRIQGSGHAAQAGGAAGKGWRRWLVADAFARREVTWLPRARISACACRACHARLTQGGERRSRPGTSLPPSRPCRGPDSAGRVDACGRSRGSAGLQQAGRVRDRIDVLIALTAAPPVGPRRPAARAARSRPAT